MAHFFSSLIEKHIQEKVYSLDTLCTWAEAHDDKETLRELGLCSPRKRRHTAVYKPPLEGCAEDRSKLFSEQVLKGKRQKTNWNSILKNKKTKSKTHKKIQTTTNTFFSIRVVKHWEHIVELVSLEIHKAELDPALCKPAHSSLTFSRSWPLKVLFSSFGSMNLHFLRIKNKAVCVFFLVILSTFNSCAIIIFKQYINSDSTSHTSTDVVK